MLIDGHIHYDFPADVKKILKALEVTNADFGCLESQIDLRKINQNPDVFVAKLLGEDKIYIDIALDSYLYYHQDKMNEMPDYIERMILCGADGVKMIEGKPTERKAFPIPDFDDELFEPTFAYLEKRGINITWHVNDPEEFWDDKKVPDWARRSGWFYADGTYVNNLDQYRQIENVLKRHPKLSITFAHFFFLSNELDHLSALFDQYPNISVDITPGVELFTNMSANIEKAKEFFNKYSNRILYGTDISIALNELDQMNVKDAMTRKKLCHDFLTKEKTIIKGDEQGLLGKDDIILNCLNLEREKVKQIEYQNFLDRYPVKRKLNIEKILEELKIHQKKLKEMNLDDNYLKEIERIFLSYGK